MVAIFVILTIILFILVDILFMKFSAKKSMVPTNENTNRQYIEKFRIPKGLFFHPGHTWANLDFSGKVAIGIDDFVQKLVGPIDEIKLRTLNDSIKQGDTILKLRQGNHVLELVSPVDGYITKINQELVDNPSALQTDPYISGWIYQVQPTKIANNLSHLLVGEKCVAWFKTELARFKDFLQVQLQSASPAGLTLQDGGLPVQGLLKEMNDQAWEKFQKDFLH